MIRTIPLLLAACLCGLAAPAALAPAFASAPERVAFGPPSKVWLAGDSTLHPYTSTATKFQATVAVTRVKGGQPRYSDLEVVIPVLSLKSGNGALDDNLYKALNAKRYPTIRFTATGGGFSLSEAGAVSVEARGKLMIAGAEKDAAVKTSGKLAGDTFRLEGRQELLMSNFGIQPPVLMGGLIKCSDKIVVYYDLVGRARD